MGDHRVSIKIEFEMHGVKEKHGFWVNWSDTIPDRVADWVRAQSERAFDKWHKSQFKAEERCAAEAENRERDELKRLLEKYGGTEAGG